VPKQFSPDFCRWNPSFLGDLGGHPCLTKTLACSERWRFLHPDAGHGTSWHFRYGNEAMPLRTHPDPPVSSAPWLRISSGGSNGKMGGFSIKPCSISGGYGRYGFTARWLQPIFKICLSLSLTIPFQNGWKCGWNFNKYLKSPMISWHLSYLQYIPI